MTCLFCNLPSPTAVFTDAISTAFLDHRPGEQVRQVQQAIIRAVSR